jgi:methyl-accepting chemotaxis protein
VCSTAADWRAAIDDAQATLTDTGNLSADLIRQTVDDVATATATLVTDLSGMGAPDTEAGDEAEARLSSLSDQLQQQEDVISGATDESAGGLQELLAQVSTVTGAIATMLADVSTAVDDIRRLDGAQELEDAFKDSPACQDLRPSTSPSS